MASETSARKVRSRRVNALTPRTGSTTLPRFLSVIGSPLALGSALLFYFGWVRAKTQAEALGYDASVVGYTSYDYILKSITVLFVPMFVLVGCGTIFWSAHERLLVAAGRSPRRRRQVCRLAVVFGWSWPLWLVLCCAGLADPGLRAVAVPAALTLIFACRLYCGVLATRTGGAGPGRSARIGLTVLLVMTIFWDAERLAVVLGEGYAERVVSRPESLPVVTVYCTQDLHLGGPGISASVTAGSSSGFRHRYDGLRLLHHAAGRYTLMNSMEAASDRRVYVLSERPTVRFELSGAR
jgi:hypothetical protein